MPFEDRIEAQRRAIEAAKLGEERRLQNLKKQRAANYETLLGSDLFKKIWNLVNSQEMREALITYWSEFGLKSYEVYYHFSLFWEIMGRKNFKTIMTSFDVEITYISEEKFVSENHPFISITIPYGYWGQMFDHVPEIYPFKVGIVIKEQALDIFFEGSEFETMRFSTVSDLMDFIAGKIAEKQINRI